MRHWCQTIVRLATILQNAEPADEVLFLHHLFNLQLQWPLRYKK